MFSNKKRNRPNSEKVSPPSKMSKNQNEQPSNSELMAQLNKLVATNNDMMTKIDQLEKKFSLMEKLFGEVENLKKEIETLKKGGRSNDAFKRFEIEQKKKSVLVKGLESLTTKKYEPRSETYQRVTEMFEHIGLGLTVEDYQRLGPIKPDETGSTLVRIQFWSKDDKAQLFAKFKEFGSDPIVKKISLINDYPLFQLSEVKRLSDEAFKLRQRDRSTKTRIVPQGLEVKLQIRRGREGKWQTVSPQREEVMETES
jgi:hypothetical protein